MAYPFDESFDVYGLNRKNRLDRLMRDPYSSQLTEPGLMDSSQQSENPFGGLFKPSNLQSIGSASDPSVSAKPAQSDDESLSESIRKMMELNSQYYHPEHTASDRLNQLLNSFPQEKRPSIGRTIVAGLAGMGAKEGGGYDASQKVIDEPFKGDLEKWKAQTQPAYQAAEAENQGNVNQRTLLGNMITAETASRRNRTADDKYRAEILSRDKIASDKNEVAKTRAEAYDFKQRHPTWTFDFSGPQIMAKNPLGPEVYRLGPSGHLSDREQDDLKGAWAVKAAEARAMGDLEKIQTAGSGIIEIGGKKYERDPNTGSWVEATGLPPGQATRPGTPRSGGVGTKAPNMLEQLRIRNDKLSDAYQTDPITSKYVKKISEGKFDFQPRPVLGSKIGSTLGFGGTVVTQNDLNQYDEFRKSVEPDYNPPVADKGLAPSGTTVKPQTTSPIGPSKPPVQKESFQPRSEYSTPSVGPPDPQQSNTPWITSVGKKAAGVVKESFKPPTEETTNVYGQLVRPGYVLMTNADTGEKGWIPQANADAAEKSGKFVRVK